MNFSHILFGGDYNPDQWSEEIWLEDVRLMREAGVNHVSMGIFSWARLEPRRGEYDFDWLDRLMDLLHENGVSVNLSTPTASPPAWLVRRAPEILPVTEEGTTLWHGARRHYCPHSAVYHEHATNIVTKLAERYAKHPALVMWHVDNEYACHISECYCDVSAAEFRDWLEKRYGSLDRLNHAWGTAFWSQHYSDWGEIHPPRKAPTFVNPTQQLDWARFCSDSWIECFEKQKAILRKLTPDIPITTNFMGFHKPVDYWNFGTREDVVSQDSYPDTSDPQWMVQAGMVCDLIRSIGKRRPWLLMEQAPSHVNWRQRNATKRPGVMRLGSYQAMARGADGIMFFQWRQSKAGAEKFHSGMVPHNGTDSRVWREIKSLGNELPKLNALLASQVKGDVAIILDWENWWALELDSKPSNDLKLLPQLYSYYKPFFERNITVGFVHPDADLTSYKLVVAPNLYLVTDQAAHNINQYVANGGNVVMSFFSGIVDENEHIRLGGYPAPFRAMLGLVIEEYAAHSETQSNTVRTTTNEQFECSLWSDVIRLETAQTMATFEGDYYAGNPAVTRNQFGKGTGFYVGTVLDSTGMDWLIKEICEIVGIKPVLANGPTGVEAVKRMSENSSWLFLFNHTAAKLGVQLETIGHDLLTGREVKDFIELEPSGIAIIQSPAQ